MPEPYSIASYWRIKNMQFLKNVGKLVESYSPIRECMHGAGIKYIPTEQ